MNLGSRISKRIFISKQSIFRKKESNFSYLTDMDHMFHMTLSDLQKTMILSYSAFHLMQLDSCNHLMLQSLGHYHKHGQKPLSMKLKQVLQSENKILYGQPIVYSTEKKIILITYLSDYMLRHGLILSIIA